MQNQLQRAGDDDDGCERRDKDRRGSAGSTIVPLRTSRTKSAGALKVTLPSFHGPLDLLLHLIKQHKIDIYDIPIALITTQYNGYLDAMEELSLDVAADYIYMAALLIHIKSKMLLPHDETMQAIEDPRQELVDRLLEYQRFKAVAEIVRGARRVCAWASGRARRRRCRAPTRPRST